MRVTSLQGYTRILRGGPQSFTRISRGGNGPTSFSRILRQGPTSFTRQDRAWYCTMGVANCHKSLFLSKMAILACKIVGYFDTTLLLQHFPWPRIHQSSSPRPALNDNFSTESYRFWDGTRKILRLRGLPTCRFVKLWQLLNEV